MLHVTGRDVEARTFALKFHSDNLSWQLLGKAQDVKSTDKIQTLFDAIKDSGKAVTPSELVGITKFRLGYVQKTLTRLVAQGSIQKEGRGLYIYAGTIR